MASRVTKDHDQISFLQLWKFFLDICFICWKGMMEPARRDSNHVLAFSRNVAVKAKHFIASETQWNTMFDSKLWRWSTGSIVTSYGANDSSWNFEGIGASKIF